MTDNNKSSGMGCSGTMFLIFLVLKLTGLIDWSWWWVTSPIWITLIIIGLLVVILLAVDK